MYYQLENPLLFLVFNRPLETQRVFDEIKMVKPKKLYVAADGPRVDFDEENCNKVKNIFSQIDWECDVQTLYREKNLGCKYAVSSAIDWFFENEEMGLILEDDCLPSKDFFRFCDTMLNKYKDDHRFRFVTGSNFNFGNKIGDGSYYFSRLTHVWGWASWRRSWKDYDVELSKYKGKDYYNVFQSLFQNEILAEDWNNIIQQLFDNKIDTWDYQWTITNLFNNGLSIIPNVNLIKNIGFGENATHTFESNGLENQAHQMLEENICHPVVFLPNFEADKNLLFREHRVKKRTKTGLKKVFKQFKNNLLK
jgi:GR25 family glycosyltransferase involved in LPS biosynthesis